MSDFDREQPLTDEQILELDPAEAIQVLIEREGISEAEARELYQAIADRADEDEKGPA